ncbi:hypothetical protein ACFPRL_32030 [Pseudoclavibacter helvolus]
MSAGSDTVRDAVAFSTAVRVGRTFAPSSPFRPRAGPRAFFVTTPRRTSSMTQWSPSMSGF